MFWIILIALLIVATYSFSVCSYSFGWRKTIDFVASQTSDQVLVSIILSVRNEQNTIVKLLDSIFSQTYKKYELIVIDDHSEDNTVDIISSYVTQNSFLRLLKSTSFGKKKALRQGISNASGELIVCVDADCQFGHDWLKTIVSFYEIHKPDMIIGPVRMLHNRSFFEKAQSLDFLSLSGSAGGSAGIGMPILCNGANLAFTKEVYIKSELLLCNQEVSGDDMFLLSAIKKQKGRILYLKSREAIANTYPCTTLNDFLQQRMRWVSKSKSYTDWQIIACALIVFCTQVVLLASFLGSFWHNECVVLFVILFFMKLFADSMLLIPTAKFFNQTRLLWYIFVVSLFYPVYVFAVMLMPILKPLYWKNRKI